MQALNACLEFLLVTDQVAATKNRTGEPASRQECLLVLL